jgi:hypothetical protein
MITQAVIWAAFKDKVNNNVWDLVGSGAPTNGTSGTGANIPVGCGSTYYDLTNQLAYRNTGATVGSPTWVKEGLEALSGDITVSAAGVATIAALAVTGAKMAANTIQSGQIDVGIIQRAVLSGITSAQIKALRATPLTVVAAPGVGKVIEIISASAQLIYAGTNAFTGAQNLGLKLKDNTTSAIATITGAGWVDQTASEHQEAAFVASVINSKANSDNQPLVIHNTGAAEITGNAANDNTMRVDVVYRVMAPGW